MEYRALGEFCTITSSKRIFAEQYVTEGIPFYRSKEIIEKNNNNDITESLYITEEVYENIQKKFGVPQEGHMLLTSVGTLGIPYIVKDEKFYFKDGNLTWMKDFSDELSPYYLYYWISSRFGKESLISRAIGSSQAAITIDILKKYKLLVPDRTVQDSISSVLQEYDRLIQNNTKRIKLLEQMAENLYKEWFARFRFPGHEGVEFENGLPMGWTYTTIEELSEVLQRGISPQYDDDGEYIVISQKCIRTSIVDFGESRHQTKKYKSELNLQDADTVICSTGTGTLGRVGKVIGDYPNATFDSHVTLVRAKAGISKQYLYSAIKNMQVWLENMGVGSTNQQELNRKTIKNAKIVLPDENTMKRFEEISKCIHDEIGSLIASRDNLTKQRDLLLPRLMSGKLEAK